jgi:feruloyl esterase
MGVFTSKPVVTITSLASTYATLPSTMALTDCSSLCSSLTSFNNWDVTPQTCTQVYANQTISTPTGQSTVGCAANFTSTVDFCWVTLNVKTSGIAETYMEVWLPNGNSTWNGRTMSTDNGGLNGCVHYVDMAYVSGMGFAAIGDNAGHNGSSFDGSWTLNNNEKIIDWAYRARHASVDIGKQIVKKAYNKLADYSYYIGCSTGGAQGLQSAQRFPNDFDGIISGAAAADHNHLQSWSSRFYQITGTSGNDTFLTLDQWVFVQSFIFAQCDKALDGVDDGILEDPTICDFNISAIPVCDAANSNGTSTTCLTATQIETVKDVFSPLYNDKKELIYPPLLYGSQVDSFRLGQLSGSIQGIARDWFRGAVHNDSSFDITKVGPSDYDLADQLDGLHGNPSTFNPDLSAFKNANKKLMMYHGMAVRLTEVYQSDERYTNFVDRIL